MLKYATGALALCLVTATAQAQPASRLRDIEPSPGFGSFPWEFTSVAGVTYFTASDRANGQEVWRTDGTGGGTRILKDARPGSDGSSPLELTNFEDRLFFVADASLWRSNGTTSGTVRLHPELKDPSDLEIHAGSLYFAADDGIHGRELWRTDGSETGAELVKDVAEGPADADPGEMTGFGPYVYFAATGPGGRELWRTDGSVDGTLQIWDVAPGAVGSSPMGLRVVEPRLFFAADDGVHGREPWTVDHSSGLTALVRDISPGTSTSTFGRFVEYGGVVYFLACDSVHGCEPWRSDGTANGTFLVRDVFPGGESSFARGFEVVGGVLYFAAESPSDVERLWRTDGTGAGTTVVQSPARGVHFLTAHDGRLFFTARDESHGYELWTSDGTAAGTTVLDLRQGPEGSEPSELTSLDGRLYFAARPPGGPHPFGTQEPWTSDGTLAGTALLASLGGGAPSRIEEWGVLGGRVFFAADDAVHGMELWTSDGTPDGTLLFADLLPGPSHSDPGQFTRIGDVLFFTAYADPYMVLWRTDGTAAGTRRVTGTTHPLLFVGEIARVGSTLFLDGYDEVHGQELWKSDGTPGGTVLVADLALGAGYDGPQSLTDVNGTLFFDGYDATEGRALWKSDGTPAGTVRVDAVLPGPASAVMRHLTSVGGLLYFAADDGLHGVEPWISTGTPLGTHMLRDVRPGPPGSAPHDFTALGSTALFLADDGASGIEPWRSSDGSEAGTVRLADIRPGAQGSEPRRLVTIDGGLAVFDADDGSRGREPWRTDGTEAGTHRVADLAPGLESSLAIDPPIAAWGGRAFFAASDVEHGQELWRSDGTAAGTTLVQDLVPGPSSSSPQTLAGGGGFLFFTAVDAAGREPWVLRPELTVANATAAEGTHALVDVTLIPRLDVPLAVPFATVDNSAVGGADFQPKSGVLTFPPGETLQTVDVTVLDDVTHEPIEQFLVDVTPGPNAFASWPRGIVTVLDDDVQPALTAGDAAVVEGDAGTTNATFTLRLAPVSATTVTVAYATAPGTAGVSDFGAVAGTVTFPPGATTRTVTVPAIGDVLDEPDEFFFLRLSDAEGGAVASGDGVGRIVDDDGAPVRLAALDRGQTVLASLEAAPGPAADVDLYALERGAFSSYEITVDGASGDVGDAGPAVELVAPDLATAVPSVASGVGYARALRTLNGTPAARLDYVRVRSLGCTTDCGADDTYRIRVRETTLRAPRFNESGGQRTVLILQNRGEAPLTALASYWLADGTRLAGTQVVLASHGTALVPTPAGAQGASGSISVAHDGALGALAGKAVGLDEATGLAFDTPLEAWPR